MTFFVLNDLKFKDVKAEHLLNMLLIDSTFSVLKDFKSNDFNLEQHKNI